ncbi:GNAT family N-acetyltransferase [Kitasatospora sp. NPDC097643]|uniref:GNAT family N-acetyltransferase n=1 Tax=Kitasatospora sp. NPDC097643 TaxID=3157230 RepID=UPI003333CF12
MSTADTTSAGTGTANATADPHTFRPTVIDLGDIQLRPWGRALTLAGGTVDALMAAAADPEINRWNRMRTADPAGAEAFLDRCDASWADGRSAAFAITDAHDGSLCGTSALRWTDRPDGLAMVGYWLMPAHRGRGLATRATAAVTRWGIATAAARRIELCHAIGNEASCRVADRAGFPYEGTLRASYRHADGHYFDEHIHARLATDPDLD